MPMQQPSIPLLTLTVAAAGALAANRFITAAGAYPAAGGAALGVTRTPAGAAGDLLPTDALGTTIVEAGAAFTAGAALMVDATGRAVAHTGTNIKVGQALQAAGAAGAMVEVLLIPNA
ncbi:MAG: capsid cement protein [Pseudomonadota bacterium]